MDKIGLIRIAVFFAIAILVIQCAVRFGDNGGIVTAICNDGWESYSQTANGTCARHGGVRIWINHPEK